MSTAPAAKKLAKGSFAHEELSSPETPRQDRSRQVNPDGNGRLTASLGLALVVLTLVEIATVVLPDFRS